MTGLPSRLSAPEPGWELTADVCVVGSRVAGLCVALHARAAGLSVAVVTKIEVDDGSTRWAQGGIAAVFEEGDSFEEHIEDTMIAGAGLNNRAVVEHVVGGAPAAIARPQLSRPVTRSTMRRSLPMIVTFSTGNFSSDRKSTARWAWA